MKTALAQMRVYPGDPEKNFSTMKCFVQQAKANSCSVIAFPEMCVGGYLLGDRWTDEAWCSYLMEFNDELRLLSENILILYGNIFMDKSGKNKDGRFRKYNAAYVYYNMQPVTCAKSPLPDGIAVKTLFPNYRIFDDERYFFSLQELSLDTGIPVGDLLQPFEIDIDNKKVRIGIEICEDLWFNDYRCCRKPLNVTGYLINNGADVIFNLSSSPWTYGKNWARNNRIRDSFSESGKFVPFYYVNCVSVQNNGKNIVVFDGDSTIYNQNTEVVKKAIAPFKEELIVFDDTANAQPVIKTNTPMIESKYQAIIEGIRGMDAIMGSDSFPYIIGVSGGIDSALVTALLHIAVGNKRIVSVNMPTQYNSSATRNIAKKITEELDIGYHVIPIEELVQSNLKALSTFDPSDFNCENIQAKIRGTSILSNIAGIFNGLMVCNGNKVEIALGYATLYGDVNGGIAPIGDLLKTEIFEMSRFINNEIFGKEIIPEVLIADEKFDFKMPPSAELKHNQVDPMKWGYHDALVQAFTEYNKLNPEIILQWYIDGTICENLGFSRQLFEKYNLQSPETFINDLEWVVKSFQRAVFKRIQSPPIIILSKGAFGYDVRESQLPVLFTAKYRRLKGEILSRSA